RCSEGCRCWAGGGRGDVHAPCCGVREGRGARQSAPGFRRDARRRHYSSSRSHSGSYPRAGKGRSRVYGSPTSPRRYAGVGRGGG
ncbi:unnamed protein product, partial [Laminaria digitata]